MFPMEANAHEAFPLGAASASGANEGSTFTLVHKRCSGSKAIALTKILHDHLRRPVSPRHSLPVGAAPQLARSSLRALVS